MNDSPPDLSITVPADVELIPTVRHMLRSALPRFTPNDDSYFRSLTEILTKGMQAHDPVGEYRINVHLYLSERPSIHVTVDGSPSGSAISLPLGSTGPDQ